MRLCEMARFCAFLRFFSYQNSPQKKTQIGAEFCANVQKALYAIPPLVRPPFACHRTVRQAASRGVFAQMLDVVKGLGGLRTGIP